jgi:hypothetical protein
MALHDSNSLLAPIASLFNLLGNFFAILLGTYDNNALWEERYLSSNTEDYYLHIFCWSLDEYGRARAVGFLRLSRLSRRSVCFFAVYCYRQNCGYAAERRAVESELQKRCKTSEAETKRLEDHATVTATAHAKATKISNDRIDGLERDLTGAKKETARLESDLEESVNAARTA